MFDYITNLMWIHLLEVLHWGIMMTYMYGYSTFSEPVNLEIPK